MKDLTVMDTNEALGWAGVREADMRIIVQLAAEVRRLSSKLDALRLAATVVIAAESGEEDFDALEEAIEESKL